MLFLLFASYLLWNGIQAMPFPSSNITDDLILPAADCPDPNSQRTISDITWSCLATIFACSWISLYQNIPAPGDTWWIITWRRIRVMFWAVIGPELVIGWGIRQWLCAKYIADKKAYAGTQFAWTRAHRYFIEMRGLMLYKDDEPCYTLSFHELEILIQKEEIEWPKITEKEIEDKSKSDMLSKCLVVLQTGWFVLQYIARGAQGMAITELEIATLALSTLNGVMYFRWWKKPLEARCPIPVLLKTTGGKEISNAAVNISEPTSESTPPESVPKQQSLASNIKASFRTFMEIIIIRPLAEPVEAMAGTFIIPSRAKRVPTFYAELAKEFYPDVAGDFLLIFFFFIGPIFGAIHCIAWSFHFPSHVEQLL